MDWKQKKFRFCMCTENENRTSDTKHNYNATEGQTEHTEIIYTLQILYFLINTSDLQSLDFVINSFFMKLFTAKSIETVKYCQEYFDFSLPSVLWAKRVAKFEVSFEFFCLCNIFFDFVCIAYCLLSTVFAW